MRVDVILRYRYRELAATRRRDLHDPKRSHIWADVAAGNSRRQSLVRKAQIRRDRLHEPPDRANANDERRVRGDR